MADTKLKKIYLMRMKIGNQGFLRSLITNRHSKFGNLIGGSNRENYLIGMKIITRGFSRLLITNLHLKFLNTIFYISRIRHFEFLNFECKFVIIDFENLQVPIFIEIEDFFFHRAFSTDRKTFLVAQGVKCT